MINGTTGCCTVRCPASSDPNSLCMGLGHHTGHERLRSGRSRTRRGAPVKRIPYHRRRNPGICLWCAQRQRAHTRRASCSAVEVHRYVPQGADWWTTDHHHPISHHTPSIASGEAGGQSPKGGNAIPLAPGRYALDGVCTAVRGGRRVNRGTRTKWRQSGPRITAHHRGTGCRDLLTSRQLAATKVPASIGWFHVTTDESLQGVVAASSSRSQRCLLGRLREQLMDALRCSRVESVGRRPRE